VRRRNVGPRSGRTVGKGGTAGRGTGGASCRNHSPAREAASSGVPPQPPQPAPTAPTPQPAPTISAPHPLPGTGEWCLSLRRPHLLQGPRRPSTRTNGATAAAAAGTNALHRFRHPQQGCHATGIPPFRRRRREAREADSTSAGHPSRPSGSVDRREPDARQPKKASPSVSLSRALPLDPRAVAIAAVRRTPACPGAKWRRARAGCSPCCRAARYAPALKPGAGGGRQPPARSSSVATSQRTPPSSPPTPPGLEGGPPLSPEYLEEARRRHRSHDEPRSGPDYDMNTPRILAS
jgi:hypothetical protein